MQDTIKKLRSLIEYHNEQYFIKEPKISDAEYDQLFKELVNLEIEYPEYYDENSPTNKVGYVAENTFDEIVHNVQMLSLGKAMNLDEFYVWLENIINENVKKFVVECKYDGIACSLKYDKFGKLIAGATRGNGFIGEDITATVSLIPNIPKKLTLNTELEVRGEIVLLKSGLEIINKIRKENNLKIYENVRNAASGIIRTKQPLKDLIKHLRFVPYGVVNSKNETYIEDIFLLNTIGFNFDENPIGATILNITKTINKDEIKKIFENIEKLRDSLDFDIDGIVCKALDYNDQNRLGNKINIPNWAIAFKFESEEKLTQILNVEWLLGAKGNITPRAEIKPTKIGGTTVTKPTLHNLEELKRLGVKIGDYAMLQRRGDVIPKIDRILKEMRVGSEKDIIIPTNCPICDEKLIINKAFLRCENENCGGRIHSKIRNYIISTEIENFGSSLVDKLIQQGKINDLSDIYGLKIEDISSLDRMGDKSAKKVIDNIWKSINVPLYKIIAGLTIKNVGIETAKDIADKCLTLEGFLNLSESDLVNINDIGDITCNNIIEWLNNKSNINVVNKLISYGVGIKLQEHKKLGIKLQNLTFAFTGSLSMPREKIKEIIEDNGGTNISIKKGLNYLIIGKNAKNNKIEKAEGYNAIIITEEEFLNMLS